MRSTFRRRRDAGPGQGRRSLTLVPDYHVCVVEEKQIVGGVSEAMALIARTLRNERRPITFVSGPYATSDIELSRVESVHGPASSTCSSQSSSRTDFRFRPSRKLVDTFETRS
jgi:hypothetical protein